MRFARENELHRPCRIVEQSLESFLVAEQERAAFISRETPGKPNRQNFRIEDTIHFANCLGRFAEPLPPQPHPFSHKFDKTELKFLMRLPKLRIRDVDDTAPKFRFGQMFFPCAKMLAVKRRKLWRHPGFCVNTVCHAGDWYLMHGHPDPDILPKRLGDFAMQLAHPIGVSAQAQCQNGHAKGVVWIDPCLPE